MKARLKAAAYTLGSVIVLMAVGCGPMPPKDGLMGQPAPDFEVYSAQSRLLSKTLESYKGEPVILDFWETTCGPCRILNPHLEKIYEDYKDKGLQAMAISNEPRDTVLHFEDRGPHEIPVYIDQNDLAVSAYGVTGFPTVVVVDRKGNVLYHKIGFEPTMLYDTDQAIRKAVETAIKEPS